ncbi:MAG: branched-chain amino acid ABC transporter permease [Thermomicrobiales bacterium]
MSGRRSWRRPALDGLLLALAIAAPLVVADPFAHRLLAVAALEAVLASSLNLVLGYGGLISLGHAGFFGIGAYVAALLALRLDAPFLVTLPAAAGGAALTGWFFVRPILRLRGHSFALATLAFGEIAVRVAYNWDGVTRGASGLPGVPRPVLFGWTAVTHRDNYYLALALLALTVLLVRRVVESPRGLSLVAARADDHAAASVGVDVARERTTAFALAAGIAGAAGALYAHYLTFVSVEPLHFSHTITLLAMVTVGGMATIYGPIAGAVLLTFLPEWLRGLAEMRMVFFGALLILCVLARPQGLLGRGAGVLPRRPRVRGLRAIGQRREAASPATPSTREPGGATVQ